MRHHLVVGPLALGGLLACAGAAPSLPACAAACPADASALPARAARSLFDYPKRTTPSLEETAIPSPSAAYRLATIRFPSPDGGWVTGRLGVPLSKGPHPAIIFLHGLPGNAAQIFPNHAAPLVARGAIVLAVDAPWARRDALPDFSPQDSVDQVQLIRDLQRAVDVLAARDDVDPRRIGFVGGSYGAAMGTLLVAIEKRLAAAVLFVGDGGLVSHFTDSTMTAVGPLANQPEATRQRWIRAMWPIEPLRFAAESSPVPLLLQNGKTDAAVPPDDASALHAALGAPKSVQWYDAGHGLTPSAKAAREDWIAQRLGMR